MELLEKYFSLIVGIIAIVYGVISYNSKVKNPKNRPIIFQNNKTARLILFTATPIILGIIIITMYVLQTFILEPAV